MKTVYFEHVNFEIQKGLCKNSVTLKRWFYYMLQKPVYKNLLQ